MSGFVLHPEAYTDLDEIWEYIAADSLDAADCIREEIFDAIRSLVAFLTRATTVRTSPRGLCGFNPYETM